MELLIAAVSGAVGAVIGVAGAEIARRQRDEREARERLRGAARMVSVELGMAAVNTKSTISVGELWLLRHIPVAAWREHGADLARVLSDDEFAVVAEAATKVEATHSVAESAIAGHDVPDAEFTLEPLAGMCRQAQDVLAPYAYPDKSKASSAD
jgi:hypothetical protein